MIFNIVVDCLVVKWKQSCSSAQCVDALFYADDGVFSGTDAGLLQQAVTTFVRLFGGVGLAVNAPKTKAMVSTPGVINLGLSSPAYRFRMTGQGQSARVRNANKVACHLCHRELRSSSMQRHLKRVHRVFTMQSQQLPRRLFEDSGETYFISIPPKRTHKVACPVHECTGTASNSFDMRKHFAMRHPQCEVEIAEDRVPAIRCPLCRMFVKPDTLATHGTKGLCKDLQSKRARQDAARRIVAARDLEFSIGDSNLDKVDQFCHLGRWILSNDSDDLAVHNNIRKAQSKWQRLFPILCREGANPKIMAIFYKTIVMSVLLYGSETWAITKEHYKCLSSFHMTCARRIARMRITFDPTREVWKVPAMRKVYKKTKLLPLYDYLHMRREYILPYADSLPLTREVSNLGQSRSTPRRLWTDDLSLEKLVLSIAFEESNSVQSD